jgi:hypothetical protein
MRCSIGNIGTQASTHRLSPLFNGFIGIMSVSGYCRRLLKLIADIAMEAWRPVGDDPVLGCMPNGSHLILPVLYFA